MSESAGTGDAGEAALPDEVGGKRKAMDGAAEGEEDSVSYTSSCVVSIQEQRKRRKQEKKDKKAEKADKEAKKAEEAARRRLREVMNQGEGSRKNRGWWNNVEQGENGNVPENFVPTAEGLDPAGKHWTMMLEAVTEVKRQAKELSLAPVWAYHETVEGASRPVVMGPVQASMVKQQLVTAQPMFREQDLGFRNFSHMLERAVEIGIVETAKDCVGRGTVWVDVPGSGDVLQRLLAARERKMKSDTAKKERRQHEADGVVVELTEGKIRSKGAKYALKCEENVPRPIKLEGFDLWRHMKNPRFVCAPMVEQSELAFRMLCRKYGTELAYTPMLHARLYIEDPMYRAEQFTTCPEDRPLVVQFCANEPDIFAAAAQMVAGRCDAVDLNLGCPQGIAKRGHYGSFLMDDFDLVKKLIEKAHQYCHVPVTAKIRVFDDEAKTLQYAKMIQDAGAQVLTVHGRTRDNKGTTATPADWGIIKKVKEHLSIPVISNGNIYNKSDALRCLEETGCDAVMSAEWLRRNPALFQDDGQGADVMKLAQEYLELCKIYPTPLGYIRAHLFKFLSTVPGGLQDHADLRIILSEAKTEGEMTDVLTEMLRRRDAK